MIKYILFPSRIPSKYDSDVHFISFSQLIKLYGLIPAECINGHRLKDNDPILKDGSILHLGARFGGDYIEFLKRRENE